MFFERYQWLMVITILVICFLHGRGHSHHPAQEGPLPPAGE